jgi:hypothetical protein
VPAQAEVHACSVAQPAFAHDFVSAWNKVMNLDRFDLAWVMARTAGLQRYLVFAGGCFPEPQLAASQPPLVNVSNVPKAVSRWSASE